MPKRIIFVIYKCFVCLGRVVEFVCVRDVEWINRFVRLEILRMFISDR